MACRRSGLDPVSIFYQPTALFSMDCRVKAIELGNGRFRNNRQDLSMRLTISTPLIVLLLVAPLLAGWLERGQTAMGSRGDDDDAFCRANNVKAGSSEYIACRKDR